MQSNNFIQDFIFSWGYFFFFSYVLYKKIFPSIAGKVNDFIEKQDASRRQLTGNLNNYQKEYEKKQQQLQTIENHMAHLKKEETQLEQNLMIKVKTLKFNEEIKRQQNKEHLMNFYKKKYIKHWLMNNKNVVVDMIKQQFKYDDEIPQLPQNKPPKTSKKTLDLSILDAIDQW
jgi:predicted unusual protein kinase regulating ubiquinone biosynthesis (AarF/ABC1/UbiB family)